MSRRLVLTVILHVTADREALLAQLNPKKCFWVFLALHGAGCQRCCPVMYVSAVSLWLCVLQSLDAYFGTGKPLNEDDKFLRQYVLNKVSLVSTAILSLPYRHTV